MVVVGAFLGVNSTLITETMMKIPDADRGTASAAYSLVRFTGGAVAPWLAGVLGDYAVQLPFWVGAIAVAGAIGVLASARSLLGVIDDQPGHGAEPLNSLTEAQAVSLGDS